YIARGTTVRVVRCSMGTLLVELPEGAAAPTTR
ncbi:MAG: hypothetical protein RIS86_1618, partial [Planctomycetota bacterium]